MMWLQLLDLGSVIHQLIRGDDGVDEEAIGTQFVEDDTQKLSAELHDVLCSITSEEPIDRHPG